MQKVVSNKGTADQVVQFVKPGSEEEAEINRVLLKEVEKTKFKPKQIVTLMRKEGFKWFTMNAHTKLWQSRKAKDPAKGYGVKLADGQWYWYETWVNRVREHCLKKGASQSSVLSPKAAEADSNVPTPSQAATTSATSPGPAEGTSGDANQA